MAKKMTCKEFKEAMDAVGMHFEVWGWEGILNTIACCSQYQAQELCRNGSLSAGEHLQAQSDRIEELLKERGYYDNLR